MSHVKILADGTSVRQRDIVDDLKDFIKRYEFYEDEVHKLWKDYEELEVENENLKVENARLKNDKQDLLYALSNSIWHSMKLEPRLRASRRKWGAR